MSKFLRIFIIILISSSITSCGNFIKKVDQRERPTTAEERRRQAVDEGRGIGIGSLTKRRSTTYEFSTSNPLWRASLETLDFLPLNTVDYSGGTIITDWYSDNASSNQESLKITIRFLSNEIRSNSLKIIVHKKNCDNNNNCKTSLLPTSSKINEELRAVILKRASIFEKESKNKKN